jgi:tetratricopeptide (TPR) repeat protein
VRTGIAHGILLAAVFGLAACSGKESVLVKPAKVARRPAADGQKHQPQVSPLRRKVVSLLEKKNFRQAIELLSGRNRDGLEKEYVLAVNGLLEAGDDDLSHGEYAAAASSFKAALDAYPAAPFPRERLSHDPKQIRASLEICANRMMEQGIEEYRRGRLESAIGKWKGVLAINPGHRQAKQSLDTATIQLQGLQNLKNR